MNKMEVKAPAGRLHESTPHDSAIKQVAGRADYVDDLSEPEGTLHAYLGLSTRAHAEIASLDFDAVRKAPGVVGVLTAEDVPGENDISSVHKHDEPVFAETVVKYWGQPIFCVIGETRDAARRAVRLAKIEYRDLPHATDVATAMQAGGALVTSRSSSNAEMSRLGWRARSIARRAPSPSAGRSTSISRARSPSRSPARTTKSIFTCRRSTQPRFR